MRDIEPLDLFIMASVCVRGKIRIHTLAIMALLMRRPWVTSQNIQKHAGVGRTDAYCGLYYLERKGLAIRRPVKEGNTRSYYEWKLTNEGKSVIISYEKIYRELYKLMKERW